MEVLMVLTLCLLTALPLLYGQSASMWAARARIDVRTEPTANQPERSEHRHEVLRLCPQACFGVPAASRQKIIPICSPPHRDERARCSERIQDDFLEICPGNRSNKFRSACSSFLVPTLRRQGRTEMAAKIRRFLRLPRPSPSLGFLQRLCETLARKDVESEP